MAKIELNVFQSTLPHGERQETPHKTGHGRIISIHAPAWGATNVSMNSWRSPTYFNPRSRMGSDGWRRMSERRLSISIHAPAWGATEQFRSHPPVIHISIHAPAWGATRLDATSARLPGNFNPRSRMGSDLEGVGHLVADELEFQSTLPHGERPNSYGTSIRRSIFQSTLPHGERPASVPNCGRLLIFQSTLPHGERHNESRVGPAMLEISIHAPAWGATGRVRGEQGARGISIHAPAWGATAAGRVVVVLEPISIHAPAWGATRRSARCWIRGRYFNPRSRMGSDESEAVVELALQISIHAPAWGATGSLTSWFQ